jgi:carboxypeptidase family protein
MLRATTWFSNGAKIRILLIKFRSNNNQLKRDKDMKCLLLSTPPLALILSMTAHSAQPPHRRLGPPSTSFSANAPFQNNTTEKHAGSIAGRITVGGKPAPGAAVILLKLDSGSSQRTPVANVKTDEEGRYQFKGVAPGSYDVFPAAPALVPPKEGRYGQPGKTVMVEAGEATEGVDFALTEGGVITGRVTDADGRPVVEEAVSLNKTTEQGHVFQFIPHNYECLITDDRGIYRVYGVPAGQYLVSVGEPYGARTGGNKRVYYKYTFHPGVTDRAKAVSVEVKEGAETTGVDIIVGRPQKTYAITGRVVNAENKPLPGIELGVIAYSEDGKSTSDTSGDWRSDDKGAFRIEDALPGHYLIYPRNDPSSNSFGEPISFDVKNEDVSDLEIKMSRGASISGVMVVAVEGVNDPAMKDKLSQLGVLVHVRPQDRSTTLRDRHSDGFASSRISGDGSFRVAGLRPGKAAIQLTWNSPTAPREFFILRVERNGQEINNGIEIGQGEQITGVRVVIGAGGGVIRGQVKIEGGQLEDVRLALYVRRASDAPNIYKSIELDTHGRFVIEKLVEGDYELLIGPMSVTVTGDAGGKTMSRMPTVKQVVNVNPGTVSEVTLVLSLKP